MTCFGQVHQGLTYFDLFCSSFQLFVILSPSFCKVSSRCVYTRRCYVNKLGIFHANETSMYLDPHQS